MSKFPFTTATAARALGYRVDRERWLIDGVPIRGATASISIEGDQGSRHTAARVAGGVAAGAVFLPLALIGLTKKKNARHVIITIQAADDGPSIYKLVPVKKAKQAANFANDFNVAARTHGGGS